MSIRTIKAIKFETPAGYFLSISEVPLPIMLGAKVTFEREVRLKCMGNRDSTNAYVLKSNLERISMCVSMHACKYLFKDDRCVVIAEYCKNEE